MTELSAADRFLIAEVRQGHADGWAQLVARYQGRLLAFARSQLGPRPECEDLVQEAFVGFLEGLDRFREEASLETFLFMLLRRRIVDHLRRQGRRATPNCSLQDSLAEGGENFREPADRAGSARDQLIEQEQHSLTWIALCNALRQVVARWQAAHRFDDLKVLELIFYAQQRNKDIAQRLQIDEKQVALKKHRLIERIGRSLADQQASGLWKLDESLLTQAWEQLRPSCPKRSTLGKYVLAALDEPWRHYVQFHVVDLGCRFCQANLEDLQLDEVSAPNAQLRDRILQSSLGFFRPSSHTPQGRAARDRAARDRATGDRATGDRAIGGL